MYSTEMCTHIVVCTRTVMCCERDTSAAIATAECRRHQTCYFREHATSAPAEL